MKLACVMYSMQSILRYLCVGNQDLIFNLLSLACERMVGVLVLGQRAILFGYLLGFQFSRASCQLALFQIVSMT